MFGAKCQPAKDGGKRAQSLNTGSDDFYFSIQLFFAIEVRQVGCLLQSMMLSPRSFMLVALDHGSLSFQSNPGLTCEYPWWITGTVAHDKNIIG